MKRSEVMEAEERSLGPKARWSRAVLVKITSDASGGGKYFGKILQFDLDTDVADTGDLDADTEIGTFPTDENALVLNMAEDGKSTHDLTSGSIQTDKFPGIIIHVNEDGLFVVVINNFDFEDCT